jgi:FKBP-type peptidyl-prolyl cis-trans isomerase SlyD
VARPARVPSQKKQRMIMTTETITVADDVVVTMEYLLKLEDGAEVDRSDEQDPLQFLQGRGQIIPGLEKELYGMQIGDEKKVTVAPADAYGELDPQHFETVSRDIFPSDLDLSIGKSLQLRDADSDRIFQATVSKLKDDNVVLDFNHPLAGETLFFEIRIADLRTATSEELAHGHVHGAEGHL